MTTEDEEPLKPRRNRSARSSRNEVAPWIILVIRVGFVGIMSSVAIVSAFNGWKAIRDQHFDHRWTTTTTTGVNLNYTAHSEHYEEILDGSRAVRFGVGLLAVAIMLAEWSTGMVITIVRGTNPTDKKRWTVALSVATVVSFLCLLTAFVSLLPPEQIGRRLFISVFYGMIIVMSVIVIAIVVSNQRRLGKFIFPAVAVSAVFIAPLSGGIIFGFFAWLAIATHIVLLVPALRRRTSIVG